MTYTLRTHSNDITVNSSYELRVWNKYLIGHGTGFIVLDSEGKKIKVEDELERHNHESVDEVLKQIRSIKYS